MQNTPTSTTGPTILMGGTGGLVHMMFGIGAFIEDHYDIENVNWKSISGSNYVVTSLCSKYSTSSIWKLWSLRQSDLKHRYPLTFFFKLYKMIHAHTQSILTQNQQFANYILISFLYQRKREWVHDFRSATDYVDCVVGGSFIPLVVGMLQMHSTFRKQGCIDGGVGMFPIVKRDQVPKTDLTISTKQFTKSISQWTVFMWIVCGIYSSHQHHVLQYNTGYEHARVHLKDQLDQLLPLRSDEVDYQVATGDVRWNGSGFF